MSSKDHDFTKRFARREFLSSLGITLGATMLPGWSYSEPGPLPFGRANLTVQQVIDLILADIPGAPFKETVDTIKAGNAQQVVTGIVTTMFATVDVIRQTIAAGANFIIAHEPTFYNHLDEVSWLSDDPVYQYKRELLEKHNIVVWRFHDYIHTHKPDGVLMGVLTKLGWQRYYDPGNPSRINLAKEETLEDIVALSKRGMGIRQVRIVGDLKQRCQRIALLPGAAGGRSQIKLLQQETPDLLIVGEVNEWETPEYIRDARAKGAAMALLVLGHAESEEPGLEWLVPWLQPKVIGIKVAHIPSHNPFTEA